MHLSIGGVYVLNTVYKYCHFILDQNYWIFIYFLSLLRFTLLLRTMGVNTLLHPFPAVGFC